ncbi:MAG: hypothetical protein KKE64_08200, partial [Candidatus Omnitrophica bacterium]|nr:hypothetical protein [Candidatus Omnitrophota bacterium]
MNNQDLMVVEDGMKTLSLRDVIGQVNLIQEIMRGVMKEGEHYGVIPGCGDKPTLLLPGAQKLSLTFRLRPEFEIKQTDLSCGHREYQVICTLYHIATGQLIGQGVGCCSTMEGKYRYRNASPKCPECRKETIIKGKQEYGGGWLCFAKKGGCGAKWKEGDPIIESQPVGKVEHDNPADYYNCVTPETRILTHDLQWISAGDIETGDMLIGVEEEMTDQYLRNLVIGKAIVYGRKEDIVYELIFDDGRIVRSNGEHKWLVKKVGLKGTEWVSTEEIHHEITAREGRPRHWYIMSLCSPWTEDKTKEAGYLAGLFDADGSLGTSQIQVLFAQQDNIVLARMEAGLESRGYVCTKSKCKTPEQLSCCNSKEQVYQLGIRGGFHEQMRLLGNIRPPRLLDRWLNLIDLSQRRLEGRGSGAGSPARIKKIERIGTEEIVMLGTSCGTYIAEGLVAHNTVLKMGKKRAYVDSIIMATAASDSFTQDIEDMPEIIPQKPFRNENVEPVDVEESIPTSPKKMTQGIDQPKKNPI